MINPDCRHKELVLLDSKGKKFRCMHCHLTIDEDELEDGFCPECYEVYGVRRRDFELLKREHESQEEYCCERCGLLIPC